MYGILTKSGSQRFIVTGDDNRKYHLSPLSNELAEQYGEFSCVSFNIERTPDSRRLANIKSIINEPGINKAQMRSCAESWDQEATRDSGEFVNTETYLDISSGKKCFVIGRKGSGKTAIAKQLLTSSPGGIYSFENFPFDEIYKLRSDSFTQSKYQRIWIVLYLTLALTQLAIRSTSSKKILANIEKITNKNAGPSGILGLIKKAVDHPITQVAGDATVAGSAGSIPLNPASVLKAILSILPTSNGIEKSLEEMQGDLLALYHENADKTKIYIIFDQLDEEYRERNSKFYPDLIESLFSATIWMREPRAETGEPLKLDILPVVLLRDDIFETQFETNNKAKYLTFVSTPNWDKSSLEEVVKKRLEQVAGKKEGFENLWLSLFPPFFNRGDDTNISSYEAFLRHTSRTPRDVVEFLKCILLELTKGSNLQKNKCDELIFINARVPFANYYYHQVIDGSKTQVPNITEIFGVIKDTFQGTIVSRQKLTDAIIHILDPNLEDTDKAIDQLLISLAATTNDNIKNMLTSRVEEYSRKKAQALDSSMRELLAILWDVCAIGLLGTNYTFRAKYINPESFSIKAGESIAFHPTVGVALNMDVSIRGASWNDEDDISLEEQSLTKFDRSRLSSDEYRESATSKLKNVRWSSTVKAIHESGLIFLVNDEFCDDLICFKPALPPWLEINKGDKLEVEVECTEDVHKNIDDPKRWLFTVKSIFSINEISNLTIIIDNRKYSVKELNEEANRKGVIDSLTGKIFSACVRPRKPGVNLYFLFHQNFRSDIFCPPHLTRRYTLIEGGWYDVEIEVKKDKSNDRWTYVVKNIFGKSVGSST